MNKTRDELENALEVEEYIKRISLMSILGSEELYVVMNNKTRKEIFDLHEHAVLKSPEELTEVYGIKIFTHRDLKDYELKVLSEC